MAGARAIAAVHMAAREGRAEKVARMLDNGPQLLSSEWKGDTLLRQAAREGHPGIVRLLLKRGAEIDTSNSHGDTALHLGARYGYEEVVSTLLGSGADIFRRGRWGWTALMYASYSGQVAIMRLALRSMGGRGLNERSSSGRTALWYASSRGNVDILQALLLAGADHTIADNDGQTPLQIAQTEGHLQSVHVIQWWEGELQRAYILHKARTLHGDTATRQQAPAAPVPAYLTPRVQGGGVMLQVQVRGRGGSGGPRTRAVAKRGVEDDEEVCAMVGYVVTDLGAELYTELLQGLYK